MEEAHSEKVKLIDLLNLVDDCIKINMKIIENSTKSLAQQGHSNTMITYFKESITKSKEDMRFMMLMKSKWTQQHSVNN
jgi:hypothetical protein